MKLCVIMISLSMLIDIYGVYEAFCDQEYSEISEKQSRNNAYHHEHQQSSAAMTAEQDDINDEKDVYDGEKHSLVYQSYANYLTERDIEVNYLYEDDEEEEEYVVKKRVARDASENNNNRRADREARRGGRVGRRRRPPKTTTTESPVIRNRNERESHDAEHLRHPQQQPNNTCVHCMWREERKILRLATIKQDILRKVQMSVPPNNTNYPKVPVEVLMGDHSINQSLLRHQNEEPQIEEVADQTQIVTFSEPPPEALQLFNKSIFDPKDVIYFKLQQDILKSRLHHATLYIYVKKYNFPSDSIKHLKIYRIIERYNQGDYTFTNEADVTKKVPLTAEETGQWIQLNLTAVVEKWMSPCRHRCAHGFQNYGLYISFKDFDSNNIAVISPMSGEEEPYNPWLKVVKYESEPSRSRRQHLHHAKDCDDHSNEEMCCRYNLLVDFEDIGWNHWILMPRSFNAFFCSGQCDLTISGTSHAHLVSLAKNGQTGGPCCTPLAMEPLSILYFDQHGRFQSTLIDNMVAKSCTCN